MTGTGGRGARPRHRAVRIAAVCAGLFLACGCGAVGLDRDAGVAPVPLRPATGTRQAVSKENLVHLWPLTVDHGTIECRHGDEAVFVGPHGDVYALNKRAERAGAADISPIRRDAPGGWKVSLGALRSHALGLCPTP